MCGRFSVNKKQVEDWVLDNWEVPFVCDDNQDLRPTQKVSTLTLVDNKLQQLDTSWGIKPAWSKKLLINAQGETAAIKRTFKESYQLRRCLVPCSSWFEWRKEEQSKHKYQFVDGAGSPLLMAGIWFENNDTQQLVTLTTRPNKICAEIHHRMPVLIEPKNVEFWLKSSTDSLQPLIEPNEQHNLQFIDTHLSNSKDAMNKQNTTGLF